MGIYRQALMQKQAGGLGEFLLGKRKFLRPKPLPRPDGSDPNDGKYAREAWQPPITRRMTRTPAEVAAGVPVVKRTPAGIEGAVKGWQQLKAGLSTLGRGMAGNLKDFSDAVGLRHGREPKSAGSGTVADAGTASK